MWKAVLNNNEVITDNGQDSQWRLLSERCRKEGLYIIEFYDHGNLVRKSKSCFVLFQVAGFANGKSIKTKGIGQIRNNKAYIDWYDCVTDTKLYKQVISSDQLKSNYYFLTDLAIPRNE